MTEKECIVKCGECCTKPGYVGWTVREMVDLAALLKLELREVVRRYSMTAGKDKKTGALMFETSFGPCPFIGPDGKCLVYAARPAHCREYLCERRKEDGRAQRTDQG